MTSLCAPSSGPLELGATRADDICARDDWQVLRDPEGNELCVLRPR